MSQSPLKKQRKRPACRLASGSSGLSLRVARSPLTLSYSFCMASTSLIRSAATTASGLRSDFVAATWTARSSRASVSKSSAACASSAAGNAASMTAW